MARSGTALVPCAPMPMTATPSMCYRARSSACRLLPRTPRRHTDGFRVGVRDHGRGTTTGRSSTRQAGHALRLGRCEHDDITVGTATFDALVSGYHEGERRAASG